MNFGQSECLKESMKERCMNEGGVQVCPHMSIDTIKISLERASLVDTPTVHTGKRKYLVRKNGRFDAEIIIIVKLFMYYVK